MAITSTTVWDLVRLVAFVAAVATVVLWLVAWRRGDVRLRDADDRLKPDPAAAVAFALVIVIGSVASAVAG